MENRIDEMLSKYNLNKENSILSVLDDFKDENEVREYCMRVLQAYLDLKKEDWMIGIEGGDYITKKFKDFSITLPMKIVELQSK